MCIRDRSIVSILDFQLLTRLVFSATLTSQVGKALIFEKYLVICRQLGILSQTRVVWVPVLEFSGLFLGNFSTLFLLVEDLTVCKLLDAFFFCLNLICYVYSILIIIKWFVK